MKPDNLVALNITAFSECLLTEPYPNKFCKLVSNLESRKCLAK